MEIVLVNPAPAESRQLYDRLPVPILGIGYIAAVLRERGLRCRVIDAKMEGLSPERVAELAAGEGGDSIAGITAMTHEITLAHDIATLIKQRAPGAVTAIGGAHASALPRRTLEEFRNFDFACPGEGEETFGELAAALAEGKTAENIDGIARRDGGRVALNGARDWIQDLDRLPFPAWDLFPATTTYPVISNRGCPHKCVFCMRVLGEKVRFRSTENVVAELHLLAEKHGARTVFFRDENFGLKRKDAMGLLERMIADGLHRRLRWSCQLRAGVADTELFRKMREAGCFEVGIGVESGNEKVLREIMKGITLEQVKKAVGAAKSAGLETAAFFIIGHPGETRETATDTVNFAASLNPTRISVGLMVPYPGTRVAEMAGRGEGGYKLVSRDWKDYDKYLGNALELENLTRKEMEKLQAAAFIKLYLYNFRFIELLRLLLSRRREISSMLKKWLPTAGKSSTD